MNAFLFAVAISLLSADPKPPTVNDDRLEISLFAIDPQVTTPTGIAIDQKGIVYVVENNTHFRPKEYNRPELDRILRMQDTDKDGRADKIEEFFTGLKNTMSIEFELDGALLVATRSEIFRLRDKDGDGKAEERTDLIKLETKGNYPHNGLAGFALDFRGNIYFGFGENLGADYKIIGTDGKVLTGGNEGGNIYSCSPAGKNLRLVATGFWNPFHLTFDTYGRLFTVDNDPDSRPPCRLLHVVEGGDYGFRFRNGRKGVSPFTAWNGELPATLPMVAGTGEAPCAVMAYESDNFPEEYRGELLVTSWGDHRLERYTLKPRGASFSATMKPVVTGDQNFRPVGLAMAPDGSLFMSDWVDKSYPIHGKGRIWHLRAKKPGFRQQLSEVPTIALNHPHRPWREAAARKLTRAEAIAAATNSKDERARSAAAKQVFAANPFWAAVEAKSDGKPLAETGSASLAGLREISQLTEAFARHRPKEIPSLARLGELAAKGALDEGGLSAKEEVEFSDLTDKIAQIQESQAVKAANAELMHANLAVFSDEFMAGIRRSKEVQQDAWLQLAAYHSGRKEHLTKLSESDFSPLAAWEAADMQRRDVPETRGQAAKMLSSRNPDVRFIGIRWAAEAKLTELAPSLEKLLETEAGNSRNFGAILLALDRISGRTHENTGEYFAAKFLIGSSKSVPAKIMALRMVSPNHPDLTVKFLIELSKHEDKTLQREAVRTLRLRGGDEAIARLREIVADKNADEQLRCEALLGFSANDKPDRETLLELVTQTRYRGLQAEAMRMLVGSALNEMEHRDMVLTTGRGYGNVRTMLDRFMDSNWKSKAPADPKDQQAWQKWLATPGDDVYRDGDPAAGERLFFHPKLATCFKCHEYKGRGGKIGPDLSTVAKSMTRERLLQSIVDPSREIAPQFTPWIIQATDGTVKTGVYVGEEVDGTVRYADHEGKIFKLHPRDVEDKKTSDKSIMPEGLPAMLTAQELRDLLAFLLQSN